MRKKIICLLIGIFVVFSVLYIEKTTRNMIYAGKIRMQNECQVKIRMIEIAMADYYVKYGFRPYSYLDEKGNKPVHSWRALILDMIGEKELYDLYDFNEPWNGPNNTKLHNRMPDIFRCSLHDKNSNCSSFMVVTGENGKAYNEEEHTTPFIIETTNSSVNWLDPQDFPANNFVSCTGDKSDKRLMQSCKHFRYHNYTWIYGTPANHAHPFNCISEDTKPEALKALADPSKRKKVKFTYPWGENFGIQRAVLIDNSLNSSEDSTDSP